jgi:hypothetical protein
MTKAPKCVKLKPSISSLKPWESAGISRGSWYHKGRLVAAQLDVAGLGARTKSAAPPFNYEGMSPREIAAKALLGMASGELPADGARVAACRAVLKLSEIGSDAQLGDTDSATWPDVLDARS